MVQNHLVRVQIMFKLFLSLPTKLDVSLKISSSITLTNVDAIEFHLWM